VKKAVVGLSGGVDSAVAAAILQQEGFEVIGVTLKMKHPDPDFARIQSCSAEADAAAVNSVAEALGIPCRTVECFSAFETKVLRPAAQEYLSGRTPNPCCFCNPAVKFEELLSFAEGAGADCVATGHYVRLEKWEGSCRLLRGCDGVKDQSYFLYRLTQSQLSRLCFPLGGKCKSEVRQLAQELHLPVAARPDSQDACFCCENECFGETLRRAAGLPARKGTFLYQGKVAGHHNGVHCYTVGQRKGLNIALGRPAYISRIDGRSGEIDLTTEEADLMRCSFAVENPVFQQPVPACFDCSVQIRYRSCPISAMVEQEEEGRYLVQTDAPVKSVTPGQSAVFFFGDLLLGGGVIL